MIYFLEIWLRGFAKDYLRKRSIRDEESYHPHITFVRPFDLNNENEEPIRKEIVNFCHGKDSISFSLEGKNAFEGGINYVPVINCEELLNFNGGLENLLNEHVRFVPKLNDKKILHATIDLKDGRFYCEKIDQYMLRLTGIKDKRIWFSFDFVTQKELDREESLNKAKWYRTVHQFSERYGLLPTRNGYRKIAQGD